MKQLGKLANENAESINSFTCTKPDSGTQEFTDINFIFILFVRLWKVFEKGGILRSLGRGKI